MENLCCCEYYDIDGDRNHILACCCNCYHLDESCEKFITCQPIPASLKQSFLATMRDRIRIPWHGGAKQVSVAMPFLYVPGLILLAILSPICSMVASAIATVIVWFAWKSAMMIPKFFLSWMIISFVIILSVFEIMVVPTLLIRRSENITVIVLLLTSLACIGKIYMQVKQMKEAVSSEKTSYYCHMCQIYKSGGVIHKYWIDTCVTSGTMKYYLLATLCASSSLIYVSNLHLTTICHPFRVFKGYSFLLPDDCSDVYDGVVLTMPFVTAVYGTCLGLILLLEFLVNMFALTQCLGICKLLHLIFNGLCQRFYKLKRTTASGKPSNII